MGKCGELWDDTALVDAFDHAVAAYKAMHGRSSQAAPSEKEESEDAVTTAAAGEEPVSTEAADENKDKDSRCTDVPCDAMETPQKPCEERKTTEQAPIQETVLGKERHVSESKTYSSGVTDADRNDSSNQKSWNYNELLGKYYELEEESRKVLEQLHQTNYWNYQIPGQSSEYQQVPAYSATAPDPHSSTTQSFCCCSNVPLVSVSCCTTTGQQSGSSACMPSSGGCSVSLTCDQCPGASTTCPTGETFMQFPTKVPTTNSDEVTKTAMMSAEGALNFMRSTISGNLGSLPRKETETEKDESTDMGINNNFDTTGADSDLAVVLNAWYAAGFYTGRYLMQQSMKKS